jgi:antitoxin component YwqK of YwqJK toxin-antitoxin module
MRNRLQASLCFLVGLLIVGCSRNQEEITKEYYLNGSIKSEVPIKNGKKNGLKRTYYENGLIKSIVYLKDDLRDGDAFYFSNNGGLTSVEHYMKDTAEGDFIYYDTRNKVDTIVSFDKGMVKKYMVFDPLGNIMNSTPFIIIESDKDTVKLGEVYSANIRVNFPLKGYDCNIYVRKGDESKNEIFTLVGRGTNATFIDTAKTVGEHIYNISALQIDHSKLDKNGKGYGADHKIKIAKKYWVK